MSDSNCLIWNADFYFYFYKANCDVECNDQNDRFSFNNVYH